MLCLLVLFFKTSVHAKHLPQYKEAGVEEMNTQKCFVDKAVRKTDKIIQSKKFIEKLRKDRIEIQNLGLNKHFFRMPEFLKQDQQRNYVKMAEDSFASIENDEGRLDDSKLIVCVSLGMPEKELKLLVQEASKINAELIIQGVIKDFPTTLNKITN
mgnify:CR=1 FL=1